MNQNVTPDRKMQHLMDCYTRLKQTDITATKIFEELQGGIISSWDFKCIADNINLERETTFKEIESLNKDGYYSGTIVMGDGDLQEMVGRVFYKNKDL